MNNFHSAPTSRRALPSLAPLLILCGAAALLGGCASEPESHVVSAPPPGAPTAVATATPVVVAQPQPAVAGQSTIVVTQAPPAPQAENVPPRPGSDYVWVAGYWTWHDNRYEWVAGHWAMPPRSGATWVPPRWDQEGSAYRYYEGYWD